MLCPLSSRSDNKFNSYNISIESVISEQNWLNCRQQIVFFGSLLALIYGIIIFIVIHFLQYQWIKLMDPLVGQNIDKALVIDVFIIISSSIGCISMIIKRYLIL